MTDQECPTLSHSSTENLKGRCIDVLSDYARELKSSIKRLVPRNKEKTQINKVTMGKEDPRTHPTETQEIIEIIKKSH